MAGDDNTTRPQGRVRIRLAYRGTGLRALHPSLGNSLLPSRRG